MLLSTFPVTDDRGGLSHAQAAAPADGKVDLLSPTRLRLLDRLDKRGEGEDPHPRFTVGPFSAEDFAPDRHASRTVCGYGALTVDEPHHGRAGKRTTASFADLGQVSRRMLERHGRRTVALSLLTMARRTPPQQPTPAPATARLPLPPHTNQPPP